MDRRGLDQARSVLAAALHDAEVPRRLADQAQQTVRLEQRRLREAGLAHVHLGAARVACAQLAAGLAPGRVKLVACLQILGAHLESR